jgi:phenylalanyl-tRNA synthetase beta chain
MKIPVSWLYDFVDLADLPVVEIAHLLTMAGLEVKEIVFTGLPLPASNDHGFKVSGIAWAPDQIVVAQIDEVNQHPNADRLTLCHLFDGKDQQVVLTGAPNLYPYKGQGKLEKPIKVAYAKEGARIYDGHQAGQVLTTLKRAKIRGIDSYSMVCSEKELGISEEHDGVIFLDDDAPVGMPLAEYMGDAVLEININPNMARNANVLGLARELAALTDRPLKKPQYQLDTRGESIEGRVRIEIAQPELNPRFTLALIRGIEIKESPYWVQRRLRLAGMRPISNVVDATNYTMLEIGEPLHAFDYDVLVERAADGPVVISTRTAAPGEKLKTLDDVERKLSPSNVLVCDTKGPLSLAGVMGGLETEVSDNTKHILLESAAWNFINIRKTANQHNLPSEASFRFSRGVHPALALEGLKRCLYWMAAWSGGSIAPGIIDNYPLPPKDPAVVFTRDDVKRALGIDISPQQIVEMLERLEFVCSIEGDKITAQTPPIRMDIGEDIVGKADIMEEIARMYGYDRFPSTRMADPLPPQHGNPSLEAEERVRDILVTMGLQEIITHRMTAPEIEKRLLPKSAPAPAIEYVKLANAIAPEKRVMRRSLLSSMLNVIERNARLRDSLALFEVASVYIPQKNELPLEPRHLCIAITGRRHEQAWDTKSNARLDFYDLKGIIEALMGTLHLDVVYSPAEHPSFHPGKCASVMLGDQSLGVFGELHPLVQDNYDFTTPVMAADLDLEAVIAASPAGYPIRSVNEFPPILEDIAVIVDEGLPAAQVEAVIREAGGKMLSNVRLFDVFHSEALGPGKKSLAYALTYQAQERTLTDKDAAQIRQKIIRRLDQVLGAKLRS